MAKLLKLRRGTTSQHSSFTGAEGEVTVDTTKDTLVVHDGATQGGIPLAKESAVTSASANITVSDESSDTTCFPVFVTAATGTLPPKSGTNLTFNSSNGYLTAGQFIGNLTGNVTGDVTGTADLATSITVTANNSTDETVYPLFADGSTGTQGAETDTGLTYNPSSGLLTSTGFAGALTGNVTGNCSGSAATVTGAAQTAITSTGTLTGLAIDGKAEQTAETLTAGSTVTVDCSTGNYFKLTAGQNTTIAFSNIPSSGTSYVCILEITAGSYSVTWPAAVKWPASSGGAAPSLTASKVHNFVLATSDGGTNWRAQGNVDYAS